jgi:hypothetical protein
MTTPLEEAKTPTTINFAEPRVCKFIRQTILPYLMSVSGVSKNPGFFYRFYQSFKHCPPLKSHKTTVFETTVAQWCFYDPDVQASPYLCALGWVFRQFCPVSMLRGRVRPWTSARRLCRVRVLGLLLLPLLHRTGAGLRQQHVCPIARHHRMAFNDERIVGMGRQAVLPPVPLAQRYDDEPGHGVLVRDRGQAFGQRARCFPLHPKRDIRRPGLDRLERRPADQGQFHSGFSLGKGRHQRLHLIPGRDLGMCVGPCRCGCLVWLGRRTGEEALAFLPRRPFLHELEEHTPRGPASGAIFGAHAATRLTGEGVREESGTAVLAQRPQDLAEQRDFRFLEDFGEFLHSECVHRGSSCVRDKRGKRVAPARCG